MNGYPVFVSLILFISLLFVLGIAIFSWRRLHVGRWAYLYALQDGIIALDMKDRVVAMNPGAQAIFEVQLADVIGKMIDDLLINWPDLLGNLKDVWETEIEIRMEGAVGERYVELQISPLLNSRKRVNGRLITLHDISSYKQTEITLTEARDQALETSRVKTELLARVSHELRTPLNVILGFSEMIQLGIAGHINEKQYETLDKILESTHFLTDQVNDLLNLSSIEAGMTKLHSHKFSIAEVIDEVIEKYLEEAENKSLQLAKIDSEQLLEMVYGDRDGVVQILANLVGNAIKFSNKGIIRMGALAFDDDFWVLQVSDEGPGIPAEAHELIFEPFRQIDGSMTRIHGGTGLGLAIVKQMTQLMGGTIQLESDIGEGSTFNVLLPNEAAGQLPLLT